MATKAHKLLTGTDLHEPKGVATATAGKVYVSDGAGSGVWTTINTAIQFSTGDLKPTWKATPDATWVMADDGTIGDASSGASNRANSDCVDLFTLVWNTFSNTIAPVLPSRGGSAAADWAAHSRITLPKLMGRALGVAGAGAGLTSRTIGSTTGAESVTLVTANLPPYTPTGTIFGAVIISNSTLSWDKPVGSTRGDPTSVGGLSFTGTPQGGTSTAFSVVQPTAFVNIMVKL